MVLFSVFFIREGFVTSCCGYKLTYVPATAAVPAQAAVPAVAAQPATATSPAKPAKAAVPAKAAQPAKPASTKCSNLIRGLNCWAGGYTDNDQCRGSGLIQSGTPPCP